MREARKGSIWTSEPLSWLRLTELIYLFKTDEFAFLFPIRSFHLHRQSEEKEAFCALSGPGPGIRRGVGVLHSSSFRFDVAYGKLFRPPFGHVFRTVCCPPTARDVLVCMIKVKKSRITEITCYWCLQFGKIKRLRYLNI